MSPVGCWRSKPTYRRQAVSLPAGRPLKVLQVSLLFLVTFLLLGGCSPGQREDRIFFLNWDASGTAQLYQTVIGSAPEELTDWPEGVQDFALSPDGRRIAATRVNADGSEIWVITADGGESQLVHACAAAECGGLAWAPDSRRLLFERRALTGTDVRAAPELWWLDTESAAVTPLIEEASSFGANGRISPDGDWLSYHSPELEGMILYRLDDGRTHFFLNEIGAPAAWSPDGTRLIVPQSEIVILHGSEGDNHDSHSHDFRSAVHLSLIEPLTGRQQTFEEHLVVEDQAPAWSPDGNWIAFVRRPARTNAARQLWLMRADGTEARALSDDADLNHGPPVWSNDGRYIYFQQIQHSNAAAIPSIWRLNIEEGATELVAAEGMLPAVAP